MKENLYANNNHNRDFPGLTEHYWETGDRDNEGIISDRLLYAPEQMFYNIYCSLGGQYMNVKKRQIPQPVDVICQQNRDGTVIPIRVRLTDEEGATQTYTIKEYKDLSHQGTREMPDGVYVTDRTFVFDCKVLAFGRIKAIMLYYEPSGTIWKMTV